MKQKTLFIVCLVALLVGFFSASAHSIVFAKDGESGESESESSKSSGSGRTEVREVENESHSSPEPTEEQKQAAEERKLSRDNLTEFRKKQNEEFAAKRKAIQEQKKACETQLQALRKERATQRKAKVTACAIPTPPESFATQDERKTWWETQRATRKACLAEVKTFDKETRTEILSTRQACFNQERTVLGLSTEVSSGQ